MNRNQNRNPPTAATETAVTSAITRLSAEFAGRVRTGLVARTVVAERQDLDGSSRSALPELVERLARQGLLTDGLPTDAVDGPVRP